MRKFRFDKLGIEIETAVNLEIRETKNCVRVSCENGKIATILKDSKVEFLDISHVICYRGRIVAYGNLFVETYGTRVYAKDKARIIAYQDSEIRATDRTNVKALDSSRVIAGGRAKIYLHGESKCYKKNRSRVKMNKFSDRAIIIEIN